MHFEREKDGHCSHAHKTLIIKAPIKTNRNVLQISNQVYTMLLVQGEISPKKHGFLLGQLTVLGSIRIVLNRTAAIFSVRWAIARYIANRGL